MLQEGLESGDPGTDDGRFYFHLGDAMQRVGNKEVAFDLFEFYLKRRGISSLSRELGSNVSSHICPRAEARICNEQQVKIYKIVPVLPFI